LINKLTDFFWEYCEYFHAKGTKEELRNALEKHFEWNTVVYIHDDEGDLIGACRFNVDKVESEILDVAIRPDKRKGRILLDLLLLGLRRFPNVKQLRFNSIDKGRQFITPVSLILKQSS
jgi:hypothetical protein